MGLKKILLTPLCTISTRRIEEKNRRCPFSRKGARGGGGKNWAKSEFFLSPPRCFSPRENGDQASLVKQSKLASISPPSLSGFVPKILPSAKRFIRPSIRAFFAKYRTNETRRNEGERGETSRSRKRRKGEERRRVVDKGRRTDFNNAVGETEEGEKAQRRRKNRGREFVRKTKTK